ncbi:MAG: DNA-binding response regulator [Bacteroidetes bacterium]|nr:MAG: DNA-binding response regulator [Bacteroidota bacterium]
MERGNDVQILITDTHRMYAEGLKAMLKVKKRLGNPLVATSSVEALLIMEQQPVDLLITNVQLNGVSGIDLTRKVKQRFPCTKVLAVTSEENPDILYEVAEAEAEGVILKNSGPDQFLMAINNLLNNQTFYGSYGLPGLLRGMIKPGINGNFLNGNALTITETEILSLIIRELTDEQIAGILKLNPLTISRYRKIIHRKTGTKTLVGLFRYAFENHLE